MRVVRPTSAWRGLVREPLPLELVVLTHIDDDHIAGLLGLIDALAEARETNQPALVTIAELWHNAFDDVVGDDQVADALALLESLPLVDEHGTVAGTRQGRLLRDTARKLGIPVNASIKPEADDRVRLVARPDDGVTVVGDEADEPSSP